MVKSNPWMRVRTKDVVTKAQLREELNALRLEIREIRTLLNPTALRDLTIAAHTLQDLAMRLTALAEGLAASAKAQAGLP